MNEYCFKMLGPDCKERSLAPEWLIITGITLNIFQLSATILMCIVYLTQLPQFKQNSHNYKIFVAIMVTTSSRILIWVLLLGYYVDDSPTALTYQVINRTSLLSSFLTQSFYIQQWLRVILTLQQRRGESAIKITFITIDVLVTSSCIAAIFLTLFDKTKAIDDNYGFIFDINMWLISTASLVTCIIFCVCGSLILSKIKNFYSSCSRPIIQFASITLLLSGSALLRFIGFNYRKMAGKRLPTNFLFLSFVYLIPDAVPMLTVTVMQFVTYQKERMHIDKSLDAENYT